MPAVGSSGCWDGGGTAWTFRATCSTTATGTWSGCWRSADSKCCGASTFHCGITRRVWRPAWRPASTRWRGGCGEGRKTAARGRRRTRTTSRWWRAGRGRGPEGGGGAGSDGKRRRAAGEGHDLPGAGGGSARADAGGSGLWGGLHGDDRGARAMRYTEPVYRLPKPLRRHILHFEVEIEDAVAAFAGKLAAGARVLDAGAGEGQYAGHFARQKYCGVDLAVGDAGWDYSKLHRSEE